MTYGYTRASLRDRNLDEKIFALIKVGVSKENIYFDMQPSNNQEYEHMLKLLEEGDTVILESADDLGDTYKQILEKWIYITETFKVDVKIINGILDIVLQERNYIKQRQADGIAKAKKKGIKFGRPKITLPDNFEELYARFRNQEPIAKIARDCGNMSPSTLRTRLYDRLKQEDQDKNG